MRKASDRASEIAKIERELDLNDPDIATRQRAYVEQYREANAKAAAEALEMGYPVLALAVTPAWMPEPGDILEGTVFGIITRSHAEFGTYPIVGVKTDNDEYYAVHALAQTLHDGMRAVKPQVGERVIVACLGERLSGTRDSVYHLYAVTTPNASMKPYEW